MILLGERLALILLRTYSVVSLFFYALTLPCPYFIFVVPHVPYTQPYPYLHRAQMYIYLAP